MLQLTGLRELERVIEVQAATLQGRIDKAIEQEIEHLGKLIRDRFLGSSVASDAYFKVDPVGKSIYLLYDKDARTARDYHNPAAKRNNRFNLYMQGQPFQDALKDAGYIDISPGPGEEIQVTKGDEAPGVRISAKMGPEAIRRIQSFIDRG